MSWTHSYSPEEAIQPPLEDDLLRAREAFKNAKRDLEEAHRELIRVHSRAMRNARRTR